MEFNPDANLAELLKWGREQLRAAGIEDCDISAEVLLGDILGVSRSKLLLNLSSSANSDISDKYREHISKRIQHIPLQYITGSTEFYNVIIKCDSRALIPRPETEILVDEIIKLENRPANPSILDIGTGSGNIAIALAKNLPDSKVTALDISEDALNLARSNAALNAVSERIKFLCADITDKDSSSKLGHFDIVVSNPPYVAVEDKTTLQPEVALNEPEIALFSPGDPLKFYKMIADLSSSILKSNGLIAFEIAMGRADTVEGILKDKGFDQIKIIEDLSGIERVVLAAKANF